MWAYQYQPMRIRVCMRIFLCRLLPIHWFDNTTKADRRWNNRLYHSGSSRALLNGVCLFVPFSLQLFSLSFEWGCLAVQHLILGGEQACWLALLGRLQQVALFGDFCLARLIILVHRYMLIYDHFFNWIFMEALNKVPSLKKQVHMSFLLRNSNNSCVLQ